METNDSPLFCARCATELLPGEGNLYLVKIEAIADPGPIVLDREHLAYSHQQAIDELIRQMQNLSEQEMMDQVYRRVIIYLCNRCYRKWIENPTGSPSNLDG